MEPLWTGVFKLVFLFYKNLIQKCLRHLFLLAVVCLNTALMHTAVFSQSLHGGFTAFKGGEYKTAFKELLPFAEQGEILAQSYIGTMYYNGMGIAKDIDEAIKWYGRAAEQGHPQAQYYLGWIYDSGKGVTEDDKVAFKWFLLAAEQGYPAAQNNLGVMYFKGEGVAKNELLAHMWYSIAFKNGVEAAEFNLSANFNNLDFEELKLSEEMAKECINKSYKDCL